MARATRAGRSPSRQWPRACAPQRPRLPVRLAFLEFMAPDLRAAAADAGRARAAPASTCVPLFLGAGGHVRKDLPPLLDELRARHPGVRWHAAPGDRRSTPAVIAGDGRMRAIAALALR